MLLVFALAAALCLRGFAWADSTSQYNQNCDFAMVQAQNAAEMIKWARGDFSVAAQRMGGRVEETKWVIRYDEEWVQTEAAEAFVLQVSTEPTLPLMGAARVAVSGNGEPLAELRVCWQEVVTDER